MKRRAVVPAGLALLLAVLAGCSRETDQEGQAVVPVEVTAARRGPIGRIIHAQGILRAIDQSAITPKIGAPVSRFYVNRGDHVRKGELLAVLENRDLAAAVTDAKGAYDQAEAAYRTVTSATVPDEIVKAQTDLEAAREAMDAAQKLLESRRKLFQEGALARRLVDEAAVANTQAKSQYEQARKHLESLQSVSRHEEIKSAAAQRESARGRYEAAQAQLAYSEIRSPVSGVVSERAIFPGEMAGAGTPLLTVMDISRVIARLNVPQDEASHLRVGQQASLSADGSSVEADAKVTVVSPALDPQTTTVEIWVEAANPGERLRPGSPVEVAIQAGTVPDAVVVPATALLPGQSGGTVVMVAGADGKAHEHEVAVGIRNQKMVQILSGVSPGDAVVVAGGVGLADGARVRVEKPGEKVGKGAGHE